MVSRVGKFIETESGIQLTRDRKWGTEELSFNGCRVSVWDDKKALEMGGGDGYVTLEMYLMSLSCILKMVKLVNFRLGIFHHNKKCKRRKKGGIWTHGSVRLVILRI